MMFKKIKISIVSKCKKENGTTLGTTERQRVKARSGFCYKNKQIITVKYCCFKYTRRIDNCIECGRTVLEMGLHYIRVMHIQGKMNVVKHI